VRTRYYIVLLTLFAIPVLTHSQGKELEYIATVDRTSVMVGDRIQLNLRVEGQGVKYDRSLSIPDLQPYLTVISQGRPSTEFRTQIINGNLQSWGQVRQSVVYRAMRAGEVTIPPLEYRREKKVARTEPIKIVITEPPLAGEQGGSTAWKPPSDPYFDIEVDKNTAYVGEQVVATWYIYFREPFYDPRLMPRPDSGDFMEVELGTAQAITPDVKIYGGIRWKKAFIMSKALYPIKAGDAIIEPITFRFKGDTASYDFFGRPLRDVSQTTTDPVKIKVLPLPETGRPADFSGAVGSFKIDITGSNVTRIETNEQYKFTLTVSGNGHPDYIPKPEIELPDSIELFTESAEKDLKPSGGTAVGTRTFKMIIVPHEAGEFTLPPFSFSYFDIETGTYRTAKSQRIRLFVLQGDEVASPVMPMPGEKELISTIGKDLRYIKPDRESLEDSENFLVRSKAFIALQVLPPVLFAGVLLIRRRKDRLTTDARYRRKLRALKRAKKAIDKAEKAARSDEPIEAYSLIYKALTGYLGDRFNLPEQGMTTEDAGRAMSSAGMAEEIIEEARSLLSECDRARFAPGTVSDSTANELVERARKFVRLVEKEMGR